LPIFLNNCYKLFSTFSYKSHTLLLRIVRLDIALGSSYSNSSTTLSSSLCTLKESTCKLIFLFYAKNCSLTQFFDVYQQTSKIIQIIFLQGENVIIMFYNLVTHTCDRLKYLLCYWPSGKSEFPFHSLSLSWDSQIAEWLLHCRRKKKHVITK
jgi:hypothetical protein